MIFEGVCFFVLFGLCLGIFVFFFVDWLGYRRAMKSETVMKHGKPALVLGLCAYTGECGLKSVFFAACALLSAAFATYLIWFARKEHFRAVERLLGL